MEIGSTSANSYVSLRLKNRTPYVVASTSCTIADPVFIITPNGSYYNYVVMTK